MARLTTLLSPYSNVDPYPTFGVWSGQGTYSIYDSNLACIYTSYAMNFTNTENATGTNSAAVQTSAFVASTGGAASSAYHVARTSANSADGNVVVDLTPGAGVASVMRSFSPYDINAHLCGTVIGEEGVRQKATTRQTDLAIGLYTRGGRKIQELNLGTSGPSGGVLRTSAGEPGTVGQGMISYNDRTRTLIVILGANGSSSYRAHVYTNTKRSLNNPLMGGNELYNFVSEAYAGTNGASYYYNNFSWVTGTLGPIESHRRLRVVLGDNGVVGLFKMAPSDSASWATLALNPAGTTATLTAVSSAGLTTSYGVDNDLNSGSRTNITWDNKWIFAYCNYYYYGAGVYGVFFYTPDPTKLYTVTITGAGNYPGYAVLPFGANKWIIAPQQNTDGGNLFNIGFIDPEGARANGRLPDGTTIANQGSLSSSIIFGSNNFDIINTTTDYACLVAMSQWYGLV